MAVGVLSSSCRACARSRPGGVGSARDGRPLSFSINSFAKCEPRRLTEYGTNFARSTSLKDKWPCSLSGHTRRNSMARNVARGDITVGPSCVFAGGGGYYASKQSGLPGVFRRAADGGDWKHALSEIEAFTVFVPPRDPNLVFAGTADGVYRSTDRGQNFCRADFPDRGVQVWSFLQDDADPKWMLAGGSPVSIY